MKVCERLPFFQRSPKLKKTKGFSNFFVLLADTRFAKLPRFSFSTSSLALAASATLLFFTAFGINRITQAPELRIDRSDWSWMSKLSLKVAPGAEVYGPSIEDAPEVAEIPSTPIQTVSRGIRPKKRIFPSIAVHQVMIKKATQVQPKIALPQALAITIDARGPAQVAQTPTSRELLTLRALHEQVTGHFLLSMTLESEAALALIHQADHRKLAVSTQAAHRPRVHRAQPPLKSQDQVRVTQAAVLYQEPEVATSKAPANAPIVTQQAKTPAIIEPQQPPSAGLPVLPSLVKNSADHLDYSEVTTQKSISEPRQVPQILDPAAPQSIPPDAQRMASAPQDVPLVSSSTPQYTPPLPAVLVTQVPVTLSRPAQTQVTTQTHPATVTTHPTPVIAKADIPPPRVDYSALSSQLLSLKATPSVLTPAQPASPVAPNSATEAFDWVTPVKDAVLTQMTFEGSESRSFWVKAEAPDHIPTWIRKGPNFDEAAPMISNNSGRLLSTMAGASLQTEAAIVFGKVPSGWSVRLSGRSERPLFLNAQNQTISSQQLEGDRYFAFLNVEPGAHLLYLINKAGTEVGAVGVSALTASASYLNLSSISFIQIKGHVYDGSDSFVRPMGSADVRVLGSVTTHAQTDDNGSFAINQVLSIADYPIYLETDAANGFTHRYQVSPANASQITLYRLNEKAIQAWVSQLEGSISPESGLIVAAAPNLVSAAGAQAKLSPSVHSLAASPTLRPEVYTLAADSTLQVSKPLDSENSRFISVQVSEGPVEVSLLDAKGAPAWSEIFMASPAVINMIGPF